MSAGWGMFRRNSFGALMLISKGITIRINPCSRGIIWIISPAAYGWAIGIIEKREGVHALIIYFTKTP